MNTKGNDDLREMLAAEFVLGTLRGSARLRFQSWLTDDRDLAGKVRRWEQFMSPLAESIPAVSPPAHVWTALVKRIPALQSRSTSTRSAAPSWWENLVFWRGLGLVATAALVVVVGVDMQRAGSFSPEVGTTPPVVAIAPLPATGTTGITGTTGTTLAAAQDAVVATIDEPKTGRVLAVVMMPANSDAVIVKVIASEIKVPKDKSLQLWMAKPTGDGVVSAGVLPAVSDAKTTTLHSDTPAAFRGAKAIGLSLEPLGGSAQATHVLGFGTWTPVKS